MLKKLYLASLFLIVSAVALIPTKCLQPPPSCPVCGHWASKVYYDDERKSVFAWCSHCNQEWMEYAAHGPPRQWWKFATKVNTDSPVSTLPEPGK